MTRILSLVLLVLTSAASAQTPGASPFDTHTTFSAGLTQPLLFGGANVAVSTKRGRLVAEYSHGIALDLNASEGVALTDAERDLQLDVDVPWTTGAGIGYRITPRLDVRAEVKAHRFEVASPEGETAAYTAFSVGPGVYYSLPIWKGIQVEPSVRYWPNISSTLDDADAVRVGSEAAPHEAHSFDVFVNVSIGVSL